MLLTCHLTTSISSWLWWEFTTHMVFHSSSEMLCKTWASRVCSRNPWASSNCATVSNGANSKLFSSHPTLGIKSMLSTMRETWISWSTSLSRLTTGTRLKTSSSMSSSSNSPTLNAFASSWTESMTKWREAIQMPPKTHSMGLEIRSSLPYNSATRVWRELRTWRYCYPSLALLTKGRYWTVQDHMDTMRTLSWTSSTGF